MLLSRGHPVSIIRHSGVIFEGEQGRRYASAVGKMVESVQSGLEEAAGESDVVSWAPLLRLGWWGGWIAYRFVAGRLGAVLADTDEKA